MSEPREFRCAQCGETFQSLRTTEDAEAEALSLWGVENASQSEDMAVVCDECFKELIKWCLPAW